MESPVLPTAIPRPRARRARGAAIAAQDRYAREVIIAPDSPSEARPQERDAAAQPHHPATWTRRAALGVGTTTLLAGCGLFTPRRPDSPAPVVTPTPTPTPTAPPSPLAQLSERLTAAVAAKDRGAFLAGFAPALHPDAGVVFDNATKLARFTFTAEQDTMVVRSVVGGEGAPAGTPMKTRLGEGGVLEEFTEADANQPAIWMRHPIAVHGSDGVWIAAAIRHEKIAQAWLASAREALPVLRGTDFGAWRSPAWDGSLVLELPHDAVSFQVAGAVAYVRQLPNDAAARIVITPTPFPTDAAIRRATLIHEGVHVAVAAPTTTAPLWAAEGFAEVIAVEQVPSHQYLQRDLVLGRTTKVNSLALPTQEELYGDDHEREYVVAWAAVTGAFRRWGREQCLASFNAWHEGGHPGDDEFTAAMREEITRMRNGG